MLSKRPSRLLVILAMLVLVLSLACPCASLDPVAEHLQLRDQAPLHTEGVGEDDAPVDTVLDNGVESRQDPENVVDGAESSALATTIAEEDDEQRETSDAADVRALRRALEAMQKQHAALLLRLERAEQKLAVLHHNDAGLSHPAEQNREDDHGVEAMSEPGCDDAYDPDQDVVLFRTPLAFDGTEYIAFPCWVPTAPPARVVATAASADADAEASASHANSDAGSADVTVDAGEVGSEGHGFTAMLWVLPFTPVQKPNWQALLHRGAEASERAPGFFIPPVLADTALPAAVHLSVSTSAAASEVADAQPAHELQPYTWTHVAAVLSVSSTAAVQESGTDSANDVATLRLYVNGTLSAETELTGLPLLRTSSPVYVGGDPWFATFRGLLAGAQLLNRAMSAEEVQQAANATQPAAVDFHPSSEVPAATSVDTAASTEKTDIVTDTPADDATSLALDSSESEPATATAVVSYEVSDERREAYLDLGSRVMYGPDLEAEQVTDPSLAELIAAAQRNVPEAAFAVGAMQLFCDSLPCNSPQAVRYLRVAASNGIGDAAFLLSVALSAGYGSEADAEQSRYWQVRAAAASHGPAAMALAMYSERNDTWSDAKGYIPLHYWRKAAQEAMNQKQAVVEALRLSHDTTALTLGHSGEDDHIVQLEKDRADRQNDVGAMLRLGNMYYYGLNGVPADHEAAFRYYDRAAGAQHPDALAAVAKLYAKGEGVAQNNASSLEYFRKAADKDSIDGLNGLGYMYYRGSVVEQNYTAALQYFERAAQLGSADGCYNAGQMYLTGVGTEINGTRAIELLKQGAQSLHRPCVYQLGYCYMYGLGVNVSASQASIYFATNAFMAEWNSLLFKHAHNRYISGRFEGALFGYELLAMLGFQTAQYNAAWMLYHDKAPALTGPHRAAQLLENLLRESTDVEAVVMLAHLHAHGRGLTRNTSRALELYEQAAASDSTEGAYHAAVCYWRGCTGSAPDRDRARRYFTAVAASADGPWLLGELALLWLSLVDWWQQMSVPAPDPVLTTVLVLLLSLLLLRVRLARPARQHAQHT